VSASSGELEWLMDWYVSQCNDDWEHQYGVQIGTLDNPGWSIAIDLTGTALDSRAFAPVEYNDSENDASWWACKVERNQWRGACGAKDLTTVIGLFRAWANSN